MNTQKHTIYILGNNPLKLGVLRKFLLSRFRNKVTVLLYFSSKNFLRMIHSGVDLVILDNMNEKGREPELLKNIKTRSPETEVIIHTSNDDVAVAIEAMRSGASDYIVENNRSWLRIGILADRIIAQPIKALYAEWGVMKFCGIFLITFFIMGIVVALAMKMAYFL